MDRATVGYDGVLYICFVFDCVPARLCVFVREYGKRKVLNFYKRINIDPNFPLTETHLAPNLKRAFQILSGGLLAALQHHKSDFHLNIV
jgi:hypothetical protein